MTLDTNLNFNPQIKNRFRTLRQIQVLGKVGGETTPAKVKWVGDIQRRIGDGPKKK